MLSLLNLSDTIYWELKSINDNLESIFFLLIIIEILLCFILVLLIVMVRG
jgi:hypothetical protein